MASVPILSTGRDTAVYLDNSQVNRSAEKLNSEILGTEKLKLNKALQDNEKFLEMMAVDPVALMTQRGVEMQSQELTKYNEKWAEEMRKHKGNLPQDKWIEMRKDRIGLESVQGRLAASQQRYLQELKMIESSPTKYNRDAFMQASKNFYETGEYTTGLAPALGRLNEALDKDVRAYFLSKPNEAVQSVTGKSGKVVTTIASGDPKQGSQRVLSLLFNDETGGYLQDAVNEFLTQPEEVQMKYFDSNKDGKVTEDEIALAQQFGSDIASFTTNPIVKWAMEEKGKRYQTTRPQISNPPSSGGFGVFFGQTLKTPGVKGNTQTYGDKTYNSLYDFDGSLILKNVPTKGGIKLMGRTTRDVSTMGNIEGYLKHYDPEKDVLIVAATGTDPNIDSGTLMEIPATNINQTELDKLPLKDGGKMTTVGEIRDKRQSTETKKKVFDPVTGTFK
jgi:hypothetical protein